MLASCVSAIARSGCQRGLKYSGPRCMKYSPGTARPAASWLVRHIHDRYVDAALEQLGVACKAQTDPAKIAQVILGGGTFKAPHPRLHCLHWPCEQGVTDRNRRGRSGAHFGVQGQRPLDRNHRLRDPGLRADRPG